MIKLGTPGSNSSFRVLLLGSGELGRELTIELMRLGAYVCACDRYAQAPAMQCAHESRVCDMTDPDVLFSLAREFKPHLIVPEVEALATDALVELEKEGFNVIPTAKATKATMDRARIRILAAETLGLPTAKYKVVNTVESCHHAASELGFPVVIKPLMSSSGKGQRVVHTKEDLDEAWNYAQKCGRVESTEVIVEEFIKFESEITLLTIRTRTGTFFCDPIGHIQKEGDYIESWQPHRMGSAQILEAQRIASRITEELGGRGLFGVELFLLKDGTVLFNEVSPRPHDTGMVTMATQYLSEFALHAMAIMNLPMLEVRRHSYGASVAIKSTSDIEKPVITGIEKVFEIPECTTRIFLKPSAPKGRRMGVILATGSSTEEALEHARKAASGIIIKEESK